eukprot:scaffold5273_cov158-Skeletonema_menzelii.AAC.22
MFRALTGRRTTKSTSRCRIPRWRWCSTGGRAFLFLRGKSAGPARKSSEKRGGLGKFRPRNLQLCPSHLKFRCRNLTSESRNLTPLLGHAIEPTIVPINTIDGLVQAKVSMPRCVGSWCVWLVVGCGIGMQ